MDRVAETSPRQGEPAVATLRLKAVSRTQGNNVDVKNGTLVPQGAVLDFEDVPVLVTAFRRMVRDLEFDVCEMAFTTYLCAKAHGKPFTALPIFLVRGLHHGAMVRGTSAHAPHPKELEGRRVGVNRGYTVTTGVWARGILQDEYNLDLDRVTWVPTGDEHVAEYRPPDNVEPAPAGSAPADLISSGDLAAFVGATLDDPRTQPLITDPDDAALRALQRDGLYPINHLVVVKDELLAAHHSLAADLFATFAESKQRYVQRLRDDDITEPTATDLMHRKVMEVLEDPLPYGLEPNRPMIDKLIDHALRQRIVTSRPRISELFAAGTLELTG
jgi:4,5-dihydroxyphthalate decarboxylase